MNNYTALANLGADPETLTLNGREVVKLRLAEKAPGKKAITRWFGGLFSGPDVETAGRLRKGDQILVTGQLQLTEFKPKKPRYKGEMQQGEEMPFGKILQVIRSETYFGAQDHAEGEAAEGDAEPAAPTDDTSPASAVMDDL